MKVIIAGCRTLARSQYKEVERAMEDAALEKGIKPTLIISGKAAGADALGELWADRHNIPVQGHPPDWAAHGRAAGPIRNAQMADEADALVAIWDGQSRGTRNMIQTAQKKGLTVHIHYFNP